MALVRPKALQKGNTIAFVAPASGVAALALHRLDKAKSFFERNGFQVKIYPSVLRTSKENLVVPDDTPKNAYSSADPKTRASELMQAFEDPQVKAIVCTIGGLTCHEILEYLDFDRIAANPKIVCGFSDITTLHLALFAKTRLCCFYGPSAICQFGEFPQPDEYTVTQFWKATCEPSQAIGQVVPSSHWWQNLNVNWFTKEDMTAVHEQKPNNGLVCVRAGKATGPILGGCLPVLLNVRGTSYQVDFSGAVLLLETPEGHNYCEGMALCDANVALGLLRLDGVFSRIKGMVIGRCFAYSEDQVDEFLRLVKFHTRDFDFPIIYGIDTGHSNPIMTIPLGCQVSLDSSQNWLSIDECGVDHI